jgi:hypothetical protein
MHKLHTFFCRPFVVGLFTPNQAIRMVSDVNSLVVQARFGELCSVSQCVHCDKELGLALGPQQSIMQYTVYRFVVGSI